LRFARGLSSPGKRQRFAPAHRGQALATALLPQKPRSLKTA
jgi:hypothetical protein